ncbi:MAG: AAA family ATPase, partial [Candidatus Anstonellales archaeon]
MIDRELIKTIIAEGFPERQYTSREIRLLDIGKIYTIIGPRRSGKTYLLFQIIDNLLNAGVKKEQILYVNFEDERLTSMVKEDLQTILSAFYELYPENRKRKVYFMFDEIQNAPYWSKFVRRLYDTENCEIYLTGSSAKLLSREIATELRGRTWNYEVFPFSFKEYLKSRGIKFRADMLYSKERYLL